MPWASCVNGGQESERTERNCGMGGGERPRGRNGQTRNRVWNSVLRVFMPEQRAQGLGSLKCDLKIFGSHNNLLES